MLPDESDSRCSLAISSRLLRTGIEMRLAIAPSSPGAPIERDSNLVALIVKAHQARDLLVGQGAPADGASEISNRHLTRLARLAYLAPNIIVAILEGLQPRTMTSRSLLRISSIPLDWDDQRRTLGIGQPNYDDASRSCRQPSPTSRYRHRRATPNGGHEMGGRRTARESSMKLATFGSLATSPFIERVKRAGNRGFLAVCRGD